MANRLRLPSAAGTTNDFFRSYPGALLPDGTTDYTDNVDHNGSLGIKIGGAPTATFDHDGTETIRQTVLTNRATSTTLSAAIQFISKLWAKIKTKRAAAKQYAMIMAATAALVAGGVVAKNLDDTNSAQDKGLASIASQLASLHDAQNAVADRVAAVESAVGALQSAVEEANSTVANVTSAQEELTSQLAGLSSAYDTLTTKLNDYQTSVDQALADLTTKTADISTAVDNVKQSLTALSQQAADARSVANAASVAAAQALDSVTATGAAIKDTMTTLTALQTTVANGGQLTSDQIAAIDAKQAALSAGVDALRAAQVATAQALVTAQAASDAAKVTADAAKSASDTAQATAEATRAAAADLQAQAAAAAARLTALTASVDASVQSIADAQAAASAAAALASTAQAAADTAAGVASQAAAAAAQAQVDAASASASASAAQAAAADAQTAASNALAAASTVQAVPLVVGTFTSTITQVLILPGAGGLPGPASPIMTVISSTESFDSDNLYNPTTSTFTPAVTGYYRVSAHLAWQAGSYQHQTGIAVAGSLAPVAGLTWPNSTSLTLENWTGEALLTAGTAYRWAGQSNNAATAAVSSGSGWSIELIRLP